MSECEPMYSQRPQALPYGFITITIDVDRETCHDIEAALDRWERLCGQHAGLVTMPESVGPGLGARHRAGGPA